jgi:hypothetical protein
MATGNFPIEAGSPADGQVATYTFTEDALLKLLQRVVLSDSTGAEINFGDPVPLVGADGVLIMSNANPLPISDAGGSITVDGSVTATANGGVASGSADSGNPVKVGMRYNSAGLSALAGGERVDLQSSDRGYLKVVLASPTSATGLATVSSLGDTLTFPGASMLWQASIGYVWDGVASQYNRVRNVVSANNSQGVGALAMGLPLWSTTDLSRFLIDTASSGDTPMVSATASQTTRGHRLRLTAAGTVVVKITDGAAGAVLERFDMIAGQTIHLPLSDRPYHKGTANTIMMLNLSAAVQVSGVYEYIKAA